LLQIDSRAIRTQHNTSASSRIATCQNDNTYAWNLSDYSVVEQSLQPPTDWDERNGSQELTEEEVEEFIRKEQEAAADGNNADTDSKYTPQIGMEFKTRDDAHHFFGFYGFIAGFEVVVTHTTRTTSKKRNNEIYKQEMRCHRYGKGTQKKTEEQEEQEQMHDEAKKKGAKRKTNIQVKSNCPVLMEVKLENDKWKVVRLDLDHNHELSPQNRNQLFSGRKYMTDMEKSMIRTLNNNNIPTRKMIAILSYLRGNVTALPYKAKHVQNERTKINREVKGNDMNKVIHYFMKRAAEDSTFFYKLHVDEENKVKSIYWREGISLKWYAEYGDFLSFDTTYMTNRYNLPVAPIVGISGHGHTIIFGCAFISDETTETFKWLFETFLESMGGKHPKTIITDQDQAMRAAIATVMPQTTHRNCFFHIKSKCYNKNGRCFAKNEGLPERFEDIVNNSVTEEEFEYLWQKMIADYKLEQNKYFNKMWENRNRFIPVYCKEDFYPFLQSTGRSEQTNARLKDNVGPTYSIHSFIIEYQRIIDRISIMENTEDNVSKQKRPKELQTGYKIELQAAELYNRNIFLKFQFQLKMTERLKYKETEDGKCFEVWHKSNRVHQLQTNRKYIVLTDLTKGKEEFSCICAKFSKDGILCCHILKVIVEEEIDEIPEKYFIDRWRKKESKLIRRQPEETPATNELLRFNVLSRKAALLTSKGSKSEDLMTYLDEEFDRINQEMDLIKQAIEEEQEDSTQVEEEHNEQILHLEDPIRIKNKGRPKKPVRLKAIVEEIKQKMAAQQAKKNKNPTSRSKGSELNISYI